MRVPCLLGLLPGEVARMPASQQQAAVDSRLPARIHREPGRHAPRAGLPRWCMEAARRRDLHDQTTAHIADGLELTDDSTRAAENDASRSARRYVERGRKVLAELGAWPWALDGEGRLERDWYCTDRYIEALMAWHKAAFCEVVEGALLAVDCLESIPEWRASERRTRQAEDLYATWLGEAQQRGRLAMKEAA